MAGCRPLSNPYILQHVFSYVGAGERLYSASVDRFWQMQYLSFIDSLQQSAAVADRHVHGSTCTSTSAIYGSPSRLKLARDSLWLPLPVESSKNNSTNELLCYNAGKFADLKTLASERELGMPFNEQLLRGAFNSESPHQVNRVLELWLTESKCTDCGTPGERAFKVAVRSGSLDAVRRVHERVSQGCQQTFWQSSEAVLMDTLALRFAATFRGSWLQTSLRVAT
jgi:hypothetical protein